MKPQVVFTDAERWAIDVLHGEVAATVGVSLPSDWTRASGPHVAVSLDGAPLVQYPIRVAATVRVTCWHSSTTEAKRLAGECMALLLAHPGDAGVFSTNSLTGVQPAKDPDNGADLAFFTVRVNLRPAAA